MGHAIPNFVNVYEKTLVWCGSTSNGIEKNSPPVPSYTNPNHGQGSRSTLENCYRFQLYLPRIVATSSILFWKGKEKDFDFMEGGMGQTYYQHDGLANWHTSQLLHSEVDERTCKFLYSDCCRHIIGILLSSALWFEKFSILVWLQYIISLEN